MTKLSGLIAAPFTPMDDKGNLNLEKIPMLASLYEKNGVNGAFISGSTGEGVSLTFAEKIQLMEKWAEMKSDKLQAFFMLGGTSVSEMQQLAEHAAECGMDGISILCPYYFRPASVEKLVDFCAQVANSVPDLPFYYYHIPVLTGGYFSMLDFLALAEEKIPSLAGIKYTHQNIMEFHACARYNEGKYDLLWGTDEAMLSGLVVGARGAVGSTYNYAAPLYRQIIDAFNAGDINSAESLQFKAVQMVQILVKYGGNEAGKAFMKLIGVDCGWFRAPLQPLSQDALQVMKRDLEKIDFFSFCSQL